MTDQITLEMFQRWARMHDISDDKIRADLASDEKNRAILTEFFLHWAGDHTIEEWDAIRITLKRVPTPVLEEGRDALNGIKHVLWTVVNADGLLDTGCVFLAF